MQTILLLFGFLALVIMMIAVFTKDTKLSSTIDYSDFRYAYHKDSNMSKKPQDYPIQPITKSSVLWDEDTGRFLNLL